MALFAAGLSHKNAPIALREQLALDLALYRSQIRDELIEKKTIEGARVHEIIEDLRKRYPKDVGAPGPEVALDAKAGTTTAGEANGAAEKEKKTSKKKDD